MPAVDRAIGRDARPPRATRLVEILDERPAGYLTAVPGLGGAGTAGAGAAGVGGFTTGAGTGAGAALGATGAGGGTLLGAHGAGGGGGAHGAGGGGAHVPVSFQVHDSGDLQIRRVTRSPIGGVRTVFQ